VINVTDFSVTVQGTVKYVSYLSVTAKCALRFVADFGVTGQGGENM